MNITLTYIHLVFEVAVSLGQTHHIGRQLLFDPKLSQRQPGSTTLPNPALVQLEYPFVRPPALAMIGSCVARYDCSTLPGWTD